MSIFLPRNFLGFFLESFFFPGDGVMISHRWQGEAVFHLTPPIWLKFEFKLIPAKIGLCSEVIPYSSRRPLFGAHSCFPDPEHYQCENRGEGELLQCFAVDFFWCSPLLYLSVLTIAGPTNGDFSGLPTGVSSDSVLFNLLLPALGFQCC